MIRTKRAPFIRLGLVSLLLIAAVAVIVGVVYFLRIALSALGNLATLPADYSAPRSVFTVIAIGFLAMALIQALRSVLPLRGLFHENRIRRWLFKIEKMLVQEKQRRQAHPTSPSERNEAEREATLVARAQADADVNRLLTIANASDETAFFNAPIEQVCGQISAVAEFLLSESLTGSTHSTEPMDGPGSPVYLLTALAGRRGSLDAFTGLRAGRASLNDDLRSRLGYYIQRNIDQLQISVASQWQRLLRGAAMAVSFTIALTVLSRGTPDGHGIISNLNWAHKAGIALMVGLTSGYLASVLRDSVAVIERLRRP